MLWCHDLLPVSNPFCVILLNWWCKSCDGHLHSCSHLQLSIQSASHLAMVHASQFRAFDLARCHTTESLNLLDCFYPLSRYDPTRHSVDRWLNMQHLTTLPNNNNFATGDTMATLFLNPFLLSPFLPVKTLLEYRMCVHELHAISQTSASPQLPLNPCNWQSLILHTLYTWWWCCFSLKHKEQFSF